MTVTEKVSYLKGLAEGLGIDENEKMCWTIWPSQLPILRTASMN